MDLSSGREEHAMKKNLRETIRKVDDFGELYEWRKHETVPHDHKPVAKKPKYPDEFADEYVEMLSEDEN
jgi:hypothetical protein